MEAFSSLGSSVRLRDLASLTSPHSLSLPLAPSHPLSLPGFPWAPGTFLGPQKALGAFWMPLAALGLQSDSEALLLLLPLTSPCSLSLPLASSHPLSLSEPLGPSWGLRKPWEPLEAFGSLGSSVRLRGLASVAPPHLPLLPLTPSHPFSPPEPPWVFLGPGTFLGPQKVLGAFRSLWQPWVFSQTQGPCFHCSPSPPLTPSHSLSPLLASLASLGPSWGLRKPWEPLEAFSSLGSSVRLRDLASLAPLTSPCSLSLPLAPSRSLSLPGLPWAPGTFLGPQKALGAFWMPLAALGLQSDSEVLLPLLPLTSPCSLSLPLAPSHPSCPLSLPGFSSVPGTFLGPQKALGAFASLWQLWVFSQTQGPYFPCSPSPPLTLSCSLLPPLSSSASLGP